MNLNPKFLAALESGKTQKVKELLEKGVSPNISVENDESPLIIATEGNHKEICELLLEYGADINHQESHGYTALHLAARQEFAEICELLLDKGADLTIVNDLEETPVDYDFLKLVMKKRVAKKVNESLKEIEI